MTKIPDCPIIQFITVFCYESKHINGMKDNKLISRVLLLPGNELAVYYSNHLNTKHLNTRFIWIPDSMVVQYSNCKVTWLGQPFEYHTFWTTNRLFSVRFSNHHLNTGPFDNRKHLYHWNTRLVWWYSDGYCTDYCSGKLVSEEQQLIKIYFDDVTAKNLSIILSQITPSYLSAASVSKVSTNYNKN